MSLIELKKTIFEQKEAIDAFFRDQNTSSQLPLYTSVDIRVNAVKAAVVDTNIFPAGFNNLCKFGSERIPESFKQTILEIVPTCKHILILAENHTRNTFYLDHLLALKTFLNDAGFEADIAALYNDSNTPFLDLKTTSKSSLRIHNFHTLNLHSHYDFVLLNNDLINGIPDVLKILNIPIYPSYAAGWHSRIKSEHFKQVNAIMNTVSKTFGLDPFYLTTSFTEVSSCDIQSPSDRQILYEHAMELYLKLERQYKTYNIPHPPHLFIKANSGTYGMGVTSINHPKDILELNRKNRNKLTKGKESRQITNLLIQEGVPSSLRINNNVAELCLYYAAQHYLGGFYRLNTQKNEKDNLNSQGMHFQKMCLKNNTKCPYSTLSESCGSDVIDDLNFYQFLAKVSISAAQQEIKELEAIHQ